MVIGLARIKSANKGDWLLMVKCVRAMLEYEKGFDHECSDNHPDEYIIKWELPDRYCLMCKRCHTEKIIFFGDS